MAAAAHIAMLSTLMAAKSLLGTYAPTVLLAVQSGQELLRPSSAVPLELGAPEASQHAHEKLLLLLREQTALRVWSLDVSMRVSGGCRSYIQLRSAWCWKTT